MKLHACVLPALLCLVSFGDAIIVRRTEERLLPRKYYVRAVGSRQESEVGYHRAIEKRARLARRSKNRARTRAADLMPRAKGELVRRSSSGTEASPETDEVWIYDNIAYQVDGQWSAQFFVAYFKANVGHPLSRAFITELGAEFLKTSTMSEQQAESHIAERVKPLLKDPLSGKSVNALVPGGSPTTLGPGKSNGLSSQVVRLSGNWKDGDTKQTTTALAKLTPYGPAETYFAGPKGWLVISDIDDTIKITMTAQKTGMVQSTFVSDPTPIQGMPQLYTHIREAFSSPPFFYLSASPYNLYPFLRNFLRTFYPKGMVLLREDNWLKVGGIIDTVMNNVQSYKVGRMETIYGWFPKRHVICIGDSTQSDPEAYGQIYREHPDWVKAIFIRKVKNVPATEGNDKNSPDRFEKAFAKVPPTVWKVFDDPKELAAAVEALKAVQT